MEHICLSLSLIILFGAHLYWYGEVKIELNESGTVDKRVLFWSVFYEIATIVVLARIIWLLWKLFF